MKSARLLALVALLLPLALPAAERLLKLDPTKSYVDVDVKATVDSFTGHLDAYDFKATVDDKKKFKSGSLSFKFANLKTGKPERDDDRPLLRCPRFAIGPNVQ